MHRTRVPRRLASQLLPLLALGLLGAHSALGQDAAGAKPPATPAPARAVPSPSELEPAVDTTHNAPAPTASPAAASAAQATPGADAAARAKADATRKGGGKPKGPDRLELDTTDITGNRELPKVLYIVPWKRSDLGDVVGKPVNSLLDEVLQPLDRDVFQRQNRYYDALKPGDDAARTGAAPPSGDKP